MRLCFRLVTSHPYPVLIFMALAALVPGVFLFGLTRETSPDAFIPEDQPALTVKREVDERFGLREPLVVGVIRDAPGGIFNGPTLGLIRDLTRAIQQMPDVDPGDVLSVATEYSVYFKDGEPGFDRLMKEVPTGAAGLEALRRDVLGYELYRGTLVAEDGSAACIIVRLTDENRAEALYDRLGKLLRDFPRRDERLVVSGEPAVRATMGSAVSDDALRMNFICPVIMMLLVMLAYRTVRGTVLPMAVIGGASALALGLMSACGIPVFIVTNGIFVVIMALGVADSLHLIGQYYEEQLNPAGRSRQDLIVDACMVLWFPILITTLTDLAGFFALYLTGVMPPIRYFGLFTCVGVAGALIYSYTVIPAGLAILPLKTSRAFVGRRGGAATGPKLDIFGRIMRATGSLAYRRGRSLLLAGGLLIVGAVFGALHLTVNDARILAFKENHPIVRATRELNERFDGTSQLNIVVTANERDAFLQPEALFRIEELEAFAESLPHVGGVHSLSGWVKRAHQKTNDDNPDFFEIPEDPSDTRFYLDVLGGKTSPLARILREVVDRTYTSTNLIVRLKSSEFVHAGEVIRPLEAYLGEHFGDGRFEARLAGRVNVDYHWVQLIRATHIKSVCFSMACVLLLTGLMFRSLLAGLLCAATVGIAVLVNYACMGLGGIPLGVGTAMFASIAIGAGVNFPIHLLDRLQVEFREPASDPAEVFPRALAFTGRTLFFTAFVVAIGFGLLCVSEFRTLVRFGLLIGLGMTTSFLVSVSLLPAAVAVWRPRFIFGRGNRR
jgi:predicted RND superfamily exporter protein